MYILQAVEIISTGPRLPDQTRGESLFSKEGIGAGMSHDIRSPAVISYLNI